MQDLGTLPGFPQSAGLALNSAGQVVGVAEGANSGSGATDAFLWTPGGTNGVPSNPQMQDLGSLFGLRGTNPTVSVATTTPGALPSTPAVQTLTFDGQISGGTFNLTFNGATTAAIAWSADAPTLAANIQAALSPIIAATVTATSPITDTVSFAIAGPEPTISAYDVAYTMPSAVNNATASHPVEVVGTGGNDGASPFLWVNGTITNLNTLLMTNSPGWLLSSAYGINDSQQIVGAGVHNGTASCFLAQYDFNARMITSITDVGTLDICGLGYGPAINQVGQVAGSVGGVPSLWSNGNRISLPLPSGASSSSTYAVALNGASPTPLVVGDTTNGQALLWQDGNVSALIGQLPRKSGWVQLMSATGINDTGLIVGQGFLSSGARHAFLLTPTTKKATAPAATSAALTRTLPPTMAATQGPFSQAAVLDRTALPEPGPSLGQPPTPVPARVLARSHHDTGHGIVRHATRKHHHPDLGSARGLSTGGE
jgi:probable HAF family extracellular repeat protein